MLRIFTIFVALITFSLLAFADVPQIINYQGYLTDSGGNPVPDNDYTITFKIYPTSGGSSYYWNSGPQTVTVTGGKFTYYLGQNTPFPSDLFDGADRYLGITVGTDPEINPRVRLAAVPYALRSGDAATASGWTHNGTRITLANTQDTVIISDGTTFPSGKLYVRSATDGTTAALATEYFGVSGTGSTGVYGSGTNYGVQGFSNDGYAGYFLSQYWTPTLAASNNYNDRYAYLGHGNGAVIGAKNPLVDGTYGALADDSAAVFGKAVNSYEFAVYGKNTFHNTYGLMGDTTYGVFGHATNSTDYAVGGLHEDGPFGVLGMSTIGVYGTNGGGEVDNAGLFVGPVTIYGRLTKTTGSFKIDHPLDPAHKWLYHSFVESPDMMNVYNGNVVTDGNGFAEVTLPDYFEALNIDFRYQLTVIGTFAQAIVAEEISDNRFVIQTDKPNVKVSWQVTGVRNDPYAQRNRIEVEVDKTGDEFGKYAHPEVYDLDGSYRINSEKTAVRMR